MGAFLAALPAFISSLPTLFTLLLQAMGLIQKVVAAAEKNNLKNWMTDVETHVDALTSAKTKEEKIAASKGLAHLIGGGGGLT